VHLSLEDLVGGEFWENKPRLGFHGAKSPGAHMPDERDQTWMTFMMTWTT
jgi:hypothetical protein